MRVGLVIFLLFINFAFADIGPCLPIGVTNYIQINTKVYFCQPGQGSVSLKGGSCTATCCCSGSIFCYICDTVTTDTISSSGQTTSVAATTSTYASTTVGTTTSATSTTAAHTTTAFAAITSTFAASTASYASTTSAATTTAATVSSGGDGGNATLSSCAEAIQNIF